MPIIERVPGSNPWRASSFGWRTLAKWSLTPSAFRSRLSPEWGCTRAAEPSEQPTRI